LIFFLVSRASTILKTIDFFRVGLLDELEMICPAQKVFIAPFAQI
jgi:hypothetical protein